MEQIINLGTSEIWNLLGLLPTVEEATSKATVDVLQADEKDEANKLNIKIEQWLTEFLNRLNSAVEEKIERKSQFIWFCFEFDLSEYIWNIEAKTEEKSTNKLGYKQILSITSTIHVWWIAIFEIINDNNAKQWFEISYNIKNPILAFISSELDKKWYKLLFSLKWNKLILEVARKDSLRFEK